MAQNDIAVPKQVLTKLCEIVIESTWFSSEQSQLQMTLDIDQEEMDEIIDFAKKHTNNDK